MGPPTPRSSRRASSIWTPSSFSARSPARTRLSGPAATRRARRIVAASSWSGAIVAPPPHGARMTKPPIEPSARIDAAGRVGCREGSEEVRPVLAGRIAIQRGHRVEVVRRNARIRGSAHASAEPRRLEDPVLGLDLEADPLGTSAGRHRSRPAPGSGSLPRRPRRSSPGSAPSRAPADAASGSTQIVPIQPTGR